MAIKVDYDEDQILFIDNRQSDTYHPDDTPSYFKVHLAVMFYLSGGKWEIAILNCYTAETISKAKKNRHELYIFSNIYMGVNVFHSQFSMLRRLFPSPNNNWNYLFSNPIYVPVTKTKSAILEIHILDKSGREAILLSQRVSCTLYIRNWRSIVGYNREC